MNERCLVKIHCISYVYSSEMSEREVRTLRECLALGKHNYLEINSGDYHYYINKENISAIEIKEIEDV